MQGACKALRAPRRLEAALGDPDPAAGSPPLRTGWVGEVDGGRAVVAAVGVGRRATERGLAALLDRFEPAACAMVGFCGGCADGLTAGDLLLATQLLCEPPVGPGGAPIAGRQPIGIDPYSLEAARKAAARAGQQQLHEGPLVTVGVVATPSAKQSLCTHRGALACDMESFWAARLCHARRVPFVAARVVFDGVAERLPPIPPFGAAGYLLRHPGQLRHVPGLLLRLRRARRALDPVARALLPALLRLPAAPAARQGLSGRP